MLIEITYNVTDVFMSTTETPVYVEISFEQPGSASAVWGSITGTLSNQTDLQNALNLKVPYTGATTNVNLGEYELKAGQVTLDTSPTGTAAVGTIRWNDTTGTSETTLKGGNVIIKNGVDLVARVVNKVSPNTTLTKAAYQAVRVSGAQGQRLAIELAQANNDAGSADTIGLVTETIAPNQEGFIMTVGQLEGINTTGSLQGETWADGDVLYLSPTTAGALTNIKPTAVTGHIVVIGYVEYAHVNNGKIYVKVMNGWELDELHNVSIVTPTNNQGLFYNSSNSLWENKTIDTALGFTPVPTTRNITINGVTYDLSADRTYTISTGISGSGASGQVTYWTGSSAVSGSNNLFWNNSNNRLGINTSTPTSALQVVGTIRATNIGSPLFFSEGSDDLLLGTQGGTVGFTIKATTRNLMLYSGGLPADGGQRLQVYGDTLLRGSGNTSATTALTVQNSSSTNLFSVRNDGFTTIGADYTFASTTGYNILNSNLITFTNSFGVVNQTCGAALFNIFIDGNQPFGNYNNVFSTVTNRNSNTTSNFRAGTFSARTASSGAATLLVASSGSLVISGSGTITNAVVSDISIVSDTSAKTITNLYGIRINALTNSAGTITNTYGIYLDSLTSGTQTNAAWGIYQNGTNNNYLAGNLGIGITPTVKLHVSGDTILNGSGATSATTALTVQNSSSTNLFVVRNDGNVGIGTNTFYTPALGWWGGTDQEQKLFLKSTASTKFTSLVISGGSTGFGGGAIQFLNFAGTPVADFGTADGSEIGFAARQNTANINFYTTPSGTSPTKRLSIFASGNVGIGGTLTSDPGIKLFVSGDTLLRGSGATSATTALTVQNSSSTNLFTVRNDGNVGIGTASPESGIHLNGASVPRLTLSETGRSEKAYFQMIQGSVQYSANAYYDGTNWQRNNTALPSWNLYITPDANDKFVIRRTSSGSGVISWLELISLTSGGNFGVGVTATALVDIGASTTTRASLRIRSGTAPTTPNDGDIWFDGTDIKMRIGGVTKTFTLI